MIQANGKAKTGRPTITLSDDDVATVERLAGKLNIGEIAHILGFSERTLHRRFKDDPRVLAAYQKGHSSAIERVADSLFLKAIQGDTTAQIFYLKTQAGWKETVKVEGTHEHHHHGEQAADEFVSRIRKLAATN